MAEIIRLLTSAATTIANVGGRDARVMFERFCFLPLMLSEPH